MGLLFSDESAVEDRYLLTQGFHEFFGYVTDLLSGCFVGADFENQSWIFVVLVFCLVAELLIRTDMLGFIGLLGIFIGSS